MPEQLPSGIRRAEAWVAGALLAVLIVGVTLLSLTSSPVVRMLVVAVGSEQLTGIGEEATLKAAEAVRIFVLDPDAPPLPAEVAGVPGFDEAAVSHLVDVRDVLVPSRWLTMLLAIAVGAWIALRARTAAGRRVVCVALRAAGLILLGGAGLGVLAGVVDFSAFFAWFHGLFFTPGTWMFPESALLIRLFPLPFWTIAAAAWGALVLMTVGVLFVAARRLCFTERKYGV